MTPEQHAFRKARLNCCVAQDALCDAFRRAWPPGTPVAFRYAGQQRRAVVRAIDPERMRIKVRGATGNAYWIDVSHIDAAAPAESPEIAHDRA